jgi:hypothetical protein
MITLYSVEVPGSPLTVIHPPLQVTSVTTAGAGVPAEDGVVVVVVEAVELPPPPPPQASKALKTASAASNLNFEISIDFLLLNI